jgi:hypothetical protein
LGPAAAGINFISFNPVTSFSSHEEDKTIYYEDDEVCKGLETTYHNQINLDLKPFQTSKITEKMLDEAYQKYSEQAFFLHIRDNHFYVYIGDKIRNDVVKVLRLLRFSKTRFVFGMPPPAGLPTSFRALVETMSEFRTILKKINALLHEVSIDDGSITNLISAKASMPEEICSSVNLS